MIEKKYVNTGRQISVLSLTTLRLVNPRLSLRSIHPGIRNIDKACNIAAHPPTGNIHPRFLLKPCSSSSRRLNTAKFSLATNVPFHTESSPPASREREEAAAARSTLFPIATDRRDNREDIGGWHAIGPKLITAEYNNFIWVVTR